MTGMWDSFTPSQTIAVQGRLPACAFPVTLSGFRNHKSQGDAG